MQLIFKTPKEAQGFYKYMKNHRVKVYKHRGDLSVTFLPAKDKGGSEMSLAAFADYLISKYETESLIKILRDDYFYEDKREQADIIELVHLIIQGEKQDIPGVKNLSGPREELISALEETCIGKSGVSLESILTFTFKNYIASLKRYVALAIDEYKLEQEYTAFIEKMRQMIRTYQPVHKTVIAVDSEPYELYNDQYVPVENGESVRSFSPLLRQWGIHTKPSLIMALIGLSPANIHIFTDRQEEAMMHTIQKVFEDRVTFHPLKSFNTRSSHERR